MFPFTNNSTLQNFKKKIKHIFSKLKIILYFNLKKKFEEKGMSNKVDLDICGRNDPICLGLCHQHSMHLQPKPPKPRKK